MAKSGNKFWKEQKRKLKRREVFKQKLKKAASEKAKAKQQVLKVSSKKGIAHSVKQVAKSEAAKSEIDKKAWGFNHGTQTV